MSVVAVIPAYNEAETLGRVVEETRRHVDRIFVVDDGSSDGTDRIRAEVLRHDRNRGKGAALRTGIGAALEAGAETVLTLDGDGQHDPEYIPSLLDAVARADLAVGVRRRGRPMPRVRRLSNGFSSTLVSLVGRKRMDDVHSGFRAYRAARLRRLEIRSRRFDVEVELILKAARAGWRIVHVPVPTLYGTERSKISPAVDVVRFLRAVFVHGLGLEPWTSPPPGSGWSSSNSRNGGSGIRAC